MKLKNYINYGMCIYENTISKNDKFNLGDIVINDENEIGVIIQVHGDGDYRTDMFGNVSESEIRIATQEEIQTHRPKIKEQASFTHN